MRNKEFYHKEDLHQHLKLLSLSKILFATLFLAHAKQEWLAGCPSVQKLFCWPCLLFGCDKKTPWMTGGYDSLNNLHIAVLKHERAPTHIHSLVKLKTFGSAHIDHQVNEGARIATEQHNECVKKNRDG